ncbi:MAG TPA: hypothetical protein VFY16_13210, partial [Gemmatimonadaceae bacterium]|nr:hypothetical protein [Gemmatimonadaceae bacterium]
SAGVRQQVGQFQITASYNGVRGKSYMNFVRASQDNSLGPNYRQLFVTDDRVKTWYDALQLQIEKPLTTVTRWGGGIAYTLGRSEEQGQSTDLFWGFDAAFPTVGDRPRRRAPGDQRHNIVANGVFRLPYEVTFSTIVSLGSGITVNATDASAGFGVGNERIYTFTPPGKPFLGIGHVFATNSVDLRMEKAFNVAGGNSVSLVADVFNAFNNANNGCFNTTINPTSGAPNPNYGNAGCAGLGRRLQLGLRYGYRGGAQ